MTHDMMNDITQDMSSKMMAVGVAAHGVSFWATFLDVTENCSNFAI